MTHRPLARLVADAKIQGKSQKDIAQQCSINEARLSLAIRGKRILSMPECQRICDALGCTMNDILEREI